MVKIIKENVQLNWKQVLKDKPYEEISYEIEWGFTNDDIEELAKLHRDGYERKKIEDLLTDCNFHEECRNFKNGNYDEYIDGIPLF